MLLAEYFFYHSTAALLMSSSINNRWENWTLLVDFCKYSKKLFSLIYYRRKFSISTFIWVKISLIWIYFSFMFGMSERRKRKSYFWRYFRMLKCLTSKSHRSNDKFGFFSSRSITLNALKKICFSSLIVADSFFMYCSAYFYDLRC